MSVSFTSNGGPLLVFFAGSAWSSTAGKKVTANLVLDGNVLTSASVFTNEAASHKSLVPVSAFTCSVAAGQHTFTVTAGADTNIDLNDYFTITVTEYSLH